VRPALVVLVLSGAGCAERHAPRAPLETEPLEHEPDPGIVEANGAPAAKTMTTPGPPPVDRSSRLCRFLAGDACYAQMSDACTALACRFDHPCVSRGGRPVRVVYR